MRKPKPDLRISATRLVYCTIKQSVISKRFFHNFYGALCDFFHKFRYFEYFFKKSEKKVDIVRFCATIYS